MILIRQRSGVVHQDEALVRDRRVPVGEWRGEALVEELEDPAPYHVLSRRALPAEGQDEVEEEDGALAPDLGADCIGPMRSSHPTSARS